MEKKKKILVVDDEADFADMVKMRLMRNDYDVVIAYDGKEALSKVKTENPDAVILDILMPGMDGIAVLKKIRKIKKNLPVFMLTAFSNEERFRLANKFDAAGFIVKTNDLQKEIENITGALSISGKFKK